MITIDGVEYTEDCFEPTGTSAKTRSHIKKTLRDRLKDTYGSTKYKEFLKIDFPRIPLPENEEVFNKLGAIGKQLMDLHLMNDSSRWPRAVTFPESGENIVSEIKYVDCKVYINKTQYFGNVSELAWNFFIGGYQPVQKWLKDRKGRTLDYEDILHYGHIVYALEETDRIMKEIDTIVDL